MEKKRWVGFIKRPQLSIQGGRWSKLGNIWSTYLLNAPLAKLQITQFWPPTPLKWTIVDILYNNYPLLTWLSVDFILTTYLTNFLVHVIIEWPLPKFQIWAEGWQVRKLSNSSLPCLLWVRGYWQVTDLKYNIRFTPLPPTRTVLLALSRVC